MKYFILLICLSFFGQTAFTKTVYYKAESKVTDHAGKITINYSIGQIDTSPQKNDYLDYMYDQARMALITTTKNYLKIFDQKRGAIYWVDPKREPFYVDLIYTNGKLTGQRSNFKDPEGRSSQFESTLTDDKYSYSLNVSGNDGKKVYSMTSDSKFISKEEFDKTLKEIKTPRSQKASEPPKAPEPKK